MTDRKLATIRVISQLKPIKDADLIEVAVIDGWEVVIKKGEFNVGDLCVYFEIDSWIPHELAPFLSKGKEPREYHGIKGERLKTIKLKGQISQGLVLPLSPAESKFFDIGYDLTEQYNILKWEREIPAQLAGKMAGNFPSFIPKTDQERIQNYKLPQNTNYWEITEKLDGSSMTVFRTITEDESTKFGVCSRNYELKLEDTNNAFVSTALKLNLFEKLNAHNLNVALQGELIGPGIQKNPYELSELEYYIYDIFDIDTQRYYLPAERQALCALLNLKHVPVFADYETDSRTTISELLKFSEGKSHLNPNTQREGLVFKNNINNESFKAISNAWLLKNE
jgi:RNA ligase (TIGR02306 family)